MHTFRPTDRDGTIDTCPAFKALATLAVVLVILLKARRKVIEAICFCNVGESLDIYIEQSDVLQCRRVA